MNHVIDSSATQCVGRAAVGRQVESLLAWLNPPVAVERRSDERIAVPLLFQLTPLTERWQPVESAALTVVGKNISRRGICFYHNQPLSYRRAVITVNHPGYNDFSVEIDIGWCRFTSPGWYESGARLVAVAPAESTFAAGGGDG
jgi:hypothetical protein